MRRAWAAEFLQVWLIALLFPLLLAFDALSERSVWPLRDSLIASAFCIATAPREPSAAALLAIFAGDDFLEYTPIRLSWIGAAGGRAS